MVAALVVFAHRDVVDMPLLIGWFLGHVLVNVLRLLLIQAYGFGPALQGAASDLG